MTPTPLSGWVPSTASWQPPLRPTALQDVPKPECSHLLPVVPPDLPELHLWHKSSGDLLWLFVYKCLSRWTPRLCWEEVPRRIGDAASPPAPPRQPPPGVLEELAERWWARHHLVALSGRSPRVFTFVMECDFTVTLG